MSGGLLHEHPEFKTLLETVSQDEKIHAPSLVEKDYWIMHVLWGLQQQGFEFELKGGTSLSKGFGLIHRFSEDIDIQVRPPPGMIVETGKNRDRPVHVDGRREFFDWLTKEISIPGIIDVSRDAEFDDRERYRNAGIRLSYESHFDSVEGLKDGILLEAGFDKTQPSTSRTISSWAYDRGAAEVPDVVDNRAVEISCYRPEYTFVEKVQTVVHKYRQFQESGEMKRNFLRHYYDIYMLLDSEGVRSFIGTDAYRKHRDDRIRGFDKAFGIRPAFQILNPEFRREYERTRGLYYRGQVPLAEIVERIEPFLDDL